MLALLDQALVLAAVPDHAVTIERGEDQLKTYRFNRHVIDHRFCANCGVQPLSQAKGPEGTLMAMTNLRCAPAINLESIEIAHYDGASV